jgi:Putative MetA-pathway of phenol degradation
MNARRVYAGLLIALGAFSTVLGAQNDYYNTDAGRPVLIEDAYALERRGLELQLSPLRLSRTRSGRYAWGMEPSLEYGIANRTQLEVGVPVTWLDGSAGSAAGISGIDVSLLHTFNTETRIPAFAVVGAVLLPAGRFAPRRAYPSIKGIMTRTFPDVRLHINAQYTFGNAVTSNVGSTVGTASKGMELSRWIAGAAVDHTFPLSSVLLTAEVFARRPLASAESVEWNSGVGARYQLAPRWALDAGLGRAINGPSQAWYLTAGGAYAFGSPWGAR